MSLFRRTRALEPAPAEAEGTSGPPDPTSPGDAADPGNGEPTPSAPADDRPRTLADLPDLVRELEAFGHEIRFSDQLGTTSIPAELGRIAFRIFEVSVAIIGNRFPDPQQLHLRIRADDDELLVSIQSTGLDGLGQQGLVPESDRAVLRDRIEAIGGKLTLRRTPSGNWIGVVRLPLTGWDVPERSDDASG